MGAAGRGGKHRVRVARSPPRKRGPGSGGGVARQCWCRRVGTGGGSGAARKSDPWDPVAEEKGTCGMAAREAHPGAGTSRRLGRKEDVCVCVGGWVPGEPPGCRGPGGGRCRVWRGAPRTRRAEAPRAAQRPSASRPNALSPVLSPARPPAQVPPPDGTLR